MESLESVCSRRSTMTSTTEASINIYNYFQSHYQLDREAMDWLGARTGGNGEKKNHSHLQCRRHRYNVDGKKSHYHGASSNLICKNSNNLSSSQIGDQCECVEGARRQPNDAGPKYKFWRKRRTTKTTKKNSWHSHLDEQCLPYGWELVLDVAKIAERPNNFDNLLNIFRCVFSHR